MTRFTVKDLVEKCGLAEDAARGLVTFLTKTNTAKMIGVTARQPGVKAKGSNVYEVSDRDAVHSKIGDLFTTLGEVNE